jgi:hypothetical protein
MEITSRLEKIRNRQFCYKPARNEAGFDASEATHVPWGARTSESVKTGVKCTITMARALEFSQFLPGADGGDHPTSITCVE